MLSWPLVCGSSPLFHWWLVCRRYWEPSKTTSGSLATSPGVWYRGGTLSRNSYQQGRGIGAEGWVPQTDLETGLSFYSAGASKEQNPHPTIFPGNKHSPGPFGRLQTPASRRLAKPPKGKETHLLSSTWRGLGHRVKATSHNEG